MKRQFKFTKKAIDALPVCPADAASKEIEFSDTEVTGLRLQVNRLGRKFFLLRYQINGRKRAMKVGGYLPVVMSISREVIGADVLSLKFWKRHVLGKARTEGRRSGLPPSDTKSRAKGCHSRKKILIPT